MRRLGVATAVTVLLYAGCDAVLPPILGCPVSEQVRFANDWVEIGGPNAQFQLEPSGLRANPNPYLVITRVQPDPGDAGRLDVRVERLDGSGRVAAFVNSRMAPAAIQDAPHLPGGWFLVELSIPDSGCWRVVAAVDDAVVGTAIIDIAPGEVPPR